FTGHLPVMPRTTSAPPRVNPENEATGCFMMRLALKPTISPPAITDNRRSEFEISPCSHASSIFSFILFVASSNMLMTFVLIKNNASHKMFCIFTEKRLFFVRKHYPMRVKKYSGELVPFNGNSLRHSLARSGATAEEVELVYDNIQDRLYDGISTRELYELAFACLRQHRDSYAARYSLKKALRELGPEGFYFERWIAKLFADEGYETSTGQTVQGHAVTHEIDVVAAKAGEMLAIECKFRNDVDAKISVTTPMYFMSRVKDVCGLPFSFFNGQRHFTDGWLVTNAYFTSDSKRFG